MRLFLSYRGRIGRAVFWLGFAVFSVFAYAISHFVFVNAGSGLYAYVSTLPLLPFFFAVTTKRYHDLGKSGWNSLWWFVPIVGALYVLIDCGLWRGSLLRNEYGDPLVGPLVQQSDVEPT